MADRDDTLQQQAPDLYPPYVAPGDRERWDNAGIVATNALGDDATEEQVWSMRRVIFDDRKTYPS